MLNVYINFCFHLKTWNWEKRSKLIDTRRSYEICKAWLRSGSHYLAKRSVHKYWSKIPKPPIRQISMTVQYPNKAILDNLDIDWNWKKQLFKCITMWHSKYFWVQNKFWLSIPSNFYLSLFLVFSGFLI